MTNHRSLRTRALLTAVLITMLASAQAAAGPPVIYKCVQPDGRLEYSNVSCGALEAIDYITGNTFSIISRGAGVDPPLSDQAIRRQQRMAAEAKERAQSTH